MRSRFLNDQDLLGGIIGSHDDHHSAPYSLTEEFVAVYRMHPLIPDDLTFHSLVTGRVLETRHLARGSGPEHSVDCRAHHDVGPVLLVRHVLIRVR